jgi:hypothetical protein
MLNFSGIRSAIAQGLSAAIGTKVVEANSPGDMPNLPFAVYDFTDVDPAAGQPVKKAETNSVTLSQTEEFTVDFLFTAAGRGAAFELALRARDWFLTDGHAILKYGPAATVVVQVDQVDNRDVRVGDSWVYQYGFEVRFRAVSSVQYNETTIDKATIREVSPH